MILAVEEFVRLVSMRDYVAAAALGERVDVPVWSRNGENLDWWLKFALIPGPGEDWRIDYVTPSN